MNELGARRRRAILVLLAIIVLIVVMDLTILNVALQTIQDDLDSSNAQLQWALDSYLITFAAVMFTAGVLADRYGRRLILQGSLLVFGVASALAAYSGSIDELILWRALMGIGAAAIPAVTLAIIMTVFPPQERAGAIAVWAGAAGIAFAVGPVTGGLLLNNFWWGSVFLINVPIVIIGMILVARLVPESRSPIAGGFDPAGVLLSVAGVGILVYGIVSGGEDNDWGSAQVWGSILAGFLLLAVMIPVEARMKTPALDVSLLRKPRFAAGSFAIALVFFSLVGAIYVTTFYFQAVRGYSPLKAGLMMVPVGVGVIAVAARVPKLAMRFGPGRVVATGAVGVAVTFLGYAFVGAGTPVAVLLLLQLIFGLGWGCIMAPATASLMSVVPPMKAAAGQGVSQTLRQVFGAFGVAVIGSVLGGVYRSSLGDAVNVLPAGFREDAGGSIGNTLRAAARAGLPADQVTTLMAKSSDAFLDAMTATMLICAAFALATVVVALRWLPAKMPAPPIPPAAASATNAPATNAPDPAGPVTDGLPIMMPDAAPES